LTYGELVQFVKEALEGYEQSFVDNIPNFVRWCEEDISRTVQIPEVKSLYTMTFDADQRDVDVPPGFLSVYSMSVTEDGKSSYLLVKNYDFLREAFPDGSGRGVPRFYTQKDENTLTIAPTPDKQYIGELYFYKKITSLTEGGDSGTTWLSENAELALVYGTILQGYIYLKGEADIIASYQSEYSKAVENLKLLAEGRQRKDSYRRPDIRLPV